MRQKPVQNTKWILYHQGKRLCPKVYLPSDIQQNRSLPQNYCKLRFDDQDCWLEENKRMFILNVQKIWSGDKEKILDTLLKDVETLKLNLYKHYNLPETRDLIKDKLKQINEEIAELHYQKLHITNTPSPTPQYKNRYIIKYGVL